MRFFKESLGFAGFIVNIEMSQWDPKTNLEWLGVILNFEEKTYKISTRRIDSILSSLQKKILSVPSKVTARQFACLAGKIISTKFVLGNIVRLKTRSLYKLIMRESHGTNHLIYFSSMTY